MCDDQTSAARPVPAKKEILSDLYRPRGVSPPAPAPGTIIRYPLGPPQTGRPFFLVLLSSTSLFKSALPPVWSPTACRTNIATTIMQEVPIMNMIKN